MVAHKINELLSYGEELSETDKDFLEECIIKYQLTEEETKRVDAIYLKVIYGE